ncbi:hypothetical protein CYMTET_51607 [Cymbomonas tetramitiformis]|uniref:Uncharacterized protein n=1 Tax=Cymbomonas tetramitiformis TaxID=36881 RepID=A0AAE0ERY0_9CHLO|nr:hypothetical protein CYMTET_51607 [Cymbomonas tetramitiformis]
MCPRARRDATREQEPVTNTADAEGAKNRGHNNLSLNLLKLFHNMPRGRVISPPSSGTFCLLLTYAAYFHATLVAAQDVQILELGQNISGTVAAQEFAEYAVEVTTYPVQLRIELITESPLGYVKLYVQSGRSATVDDYLAQDNSEYRNAGHVLLFLDSPGTVYVRVDTGTKITGTMYTLWAQTRPLALEELSGEVQRQTLGGWYTFYLVNGGTPPFGTIMLSELYLTRLSLPSSLDRITMEVNPSPHLSVLDDASQWMGLLPSSLNGASKKVTSDRFRPTVSMPLYSTEQ